MKTQDSAKAFLAKYPNVVKALRSKTINKFVAQPRILVNVEPLAQSLRRVPLVHINKVERELNRMESEGVFQKIDASLRVSN